MLFLISLSILDAARVEMLRKKITSEKFLSEKSRVGKVYLVELTSHTISNLFLYGWGNKGLRIFLSLSLIFFDLVVVGNVSLWKTQDQGKPKSAENWHFHPWVHSASQQLSQLVLWPESSVVVSTGVKNVGEVGLVEVGSWWLPDVL